MVLLIELLYSYFYLYAFINIYIQKWTPPIRQKLDDYKCFPSLLS